MLLQISMLEFLQLQFMQRALLGGIIVGALCAAIGVYVTLRKESFISEAIAHASLAGVALAFLISFNELYIALVIGVVTAIGITYMQKRTNVSSDAVIGIFFSLIFAIGIIILHFVQGYRPELTSFLFGSILSITQHDIIISALVLIISLVIIFVFYEQLLYVSFDKEGAKIKGIKVELFDYIIRIITAIAVIASIKLVGMILVTALLVIPASGAKLFAKRFSHMIPISIILSIVSVILGLWGSYYFDIPSGASIVVVTATLFIILSVGKKI